MTLRGSRKRERRKGTKGTVVEWSGGKQEEEGRPGSKVSERELEGVEREKREQGKIRRVVLLCERLGAGGLEQVITSGCGADAARAGPS